MRGRKVDSNHASIVATLRSIGWTVRDTSALGGGFSDLVAARRGCLRLIEVKDGTRPPSARKLTPKEADFRAEMQAAGVDVVIVESIEDALELR